MWPDLAVPGWQEASTALHLFTQVVGKTRLALEPMANHWWQVTLYVSARGLTTSPMRASGRLVEVELDLIAHRLHIRSSDGGDESFALTDCPTVADFHARYFQALDRLGVEVSIQPLAVEIADTVYLDRDRTIRRYDPEWARRLYSVLAEVFPVLCEFRAGFMGKASPVHFFWGGFDLAVTRFSGRTAPRHPGGAPHVRREVMEEAYSHEVSSAGFWMGGAACPGPMFYAYAYPEPDGFAAAPGAPEGASYDLQLREWVLPYEAVRTAPSPRRALERFLDATYAAAAELGHWNRAALERPAHAKEESHGVPL